MGTGSPVPLMPGNPRPAEPGSRVPESSSARAVSRGRCTPHTSLFKWTFSKLLNPCSSVQDTQVAADHSVSLVNPVIPRGPLCRPQKGNLFASPHHPKKAKREQSLLLGAPGETVLPQGRLWRCRCQPGALQVQAQTLLAGPAQQGPRAHSTPCQPSGTFSLLIMEVG